MGETSAHTAIGSAAIKLTARLGNSAARFEAAKFTWVGNMEESVAVCGVTKAAGIAKFDDMRTKEVIISSREGNSVSVVIKASNCNDRLYCVSLPEPLMLE